MEWLTIKTWAYKIQARKCWHLWFAWHPVKVKKYPDGAVKFIWLQTVKRRGEYESLGLYECGWVYEYAEI